MLFRLILIKCVLLIGRLLAAENSNNQDWTIVFYTSSQLFAGTNNDVFIELIGESGNSGKKAVNAFKHELEAGRRDEFKIKIENNIGKLLTIIVSKRVSSKFFSDWYLDKVEVYDPLNRQYSFICACQITNDKPSYKMDRIGFTKEPPIITIQTNPSKLILFIIGVAIIIVLLVYFVSTTRSTIKKWIIRRTSTRRRRATSRQTQSRANRTERQQTRLNDDENDDKDDEEESSESNSGRIYRNINQASNISYIAASLNHEDKPPAYRDLFPARKNKNKNENAVELHTINSIATSNDVNTAINPDNNQIPNTATNA